MKTVKIIIGALMVLFGIYILITNWYRQITNFINKKKGWSSPVPFFRPFLITAGYSMTPLPFAALIFFVFIIDPDTVLTVISLPWLFIGLFQGKK